MPSNLDPFSKLRSFSGTPEEFWKRYGSELIKLFSADELLVAYRKKSDNEWRTTLHLHSAERSRAAFQITELAGPAGEALKDAPFCVFQYKGFKLAAVMPTGNEQIDGLLIVDCGNRPEGEMNLLARLLPLVADVPLQYQQNSSASKGGDDSKLADILDLLNQLQGHKRFVVAASGFCSEVARRTRSARVALAWRKGAYLRLVALSDVPSPDPKMSAVDELEKTLEECLDQDDEIVFPADGGNESLALQHGKLARESGTPYLASLPLRLDSKAVAVLHLQRNDRPYDDDELTLLRVLADHSAKPLNDLRHRDRFFPLRIAENLRDFAASLIGYQHTWAKLGVFLFTALLVFSLLYKTEYRVEAPFILRSRAQVYLPAPFDGFIKTVHCDVGDYVKQDALLMTLDKNQLLLRESSLEADLMRFKNEERKFRGLNQLAEMRIAAAQAEQTKADLNLVRYQLSKASLTAPFEGYVVEGRHREHLGSPVNEGDILFRIARLTPLYIEIKVEERDIQDIFERAEGEVAFASRPEDSYQFTVTALEPVATESEDGNIFPIRGTFVSENQDWWRPGMTGLAKVNAGNRSLAWIFLHDAVDFLRLWLWW